MPAITRSQDVTITRDPWPTLMTFDDYIGKEQPSHHEHQGCFITHANMKLTEWIPAIPPQFAEAVKQHRVVYIIGVPHKWETSAFRKLFEVHGTVESCPCIIDVVAQNTFRWVIMSTAREARVVMHFYHEYTSDDLTFWTLEALPPGPNFDLLTQHRGRIGAERIYAQEVATKELAWQKHSGITPPVLNPKGHAQGLPHTVAVARARKLTVDLNNSFTNIDTCCDNDELGYSMADLGLESEPDKRDSSTTETSPVTGSETKAERAQTSGSWADVASTAAGSMKTINIHQGSHVSKGGLNTTVKRTSDESMIEQMRVVLILNLPKETTLDEISDGIREGAIVKIGFGMDEDMKKRFVGIVFHHASCAEMFYQAVNRERREGKSERFGFIPEVMRGEPFPTNDAIKAMSEPGIYATRRLTIVKKGFFFEFKERQLINLCEKHVGKHNVQLVFIYNGGNATILFAEVAAAIKFKSLLARMTATAGKSRGALACFEGLACTYSKDPCELGEPLNLLSSFHSNS